ncbi:NADPH2:quinone reductase [Dactylonectria macrodidyma]|uniref:Probable quinone oxidoreductase n=1 Tax=Dactylonectria macrodidyma TaxID=307937 RepID=A0A9P9F5K8_9HYPO|nr:NADPH2:quinone reductase [Dactylonectria macrodidyma]
MKAVILKGPGSAGNMIYDQDTPKPELSEGEVLVKNHFIGVNYVDVYLRTGFYPSPSGYPLIIGNEGAGEIVEICGENTTDLKIGDKVVWIGQGGYAEYTAMAAQLALKIPDGVSPQEAVGGFLAGMTALSLLEEAYPVQSGQTVLIHAAAGGLGSIMCQILRNIGAITFATAGGPDKCRLALENGANHAIDYTSTSGPSWVDQVGDLTNGSGVDVVYDLVGQNTWEGSLEAVKRKGKVVFVGSASGPVPPIDPNRLTPKNISIMKPTLGAFITTPEEMRHYAMGILGMIRQGTVKINITKIYDLSEVKRAHGDLEGRRTTGKILMKL